ncbi:MAG: DUF6760 family protein [Anaerolineales bacterium]
MSGVSDRARNRPLRAGGVVGYPSERLHEEVAYLAYHFHWPLDDILQLEHGERLTWVNEVAKINRRLSPAVSS